VEDLKMKVWNKPELAEINLSATESGFFDTEWEICIFTNDSLKRPTTTPRPEETPSRGVPSEEPTSSSGVTDLFSGE